MTKMKMIYDKTLDRIKTFEEFHITEANKKYKNNNLEGYKLHIDRSKDFEHIKEFVIKRIGKGYN